METILDKIVAKTRIRVAQAKETRPYHQVREAAEQLPVSAEFPFEQALARPELTFICEIKKASPSKGVIAAYFPYLEIAAEYQAAGAGAISVLTEPDFFQGDMKYLREISAAVSIPVLRKDFIIDKYQIYEAKEAGASAVLLICAILGAEQLKEYLELAHSLGLSALVEAHDEDEVAMAAAAGARVIGVNNRDLKTFTVDINNSIRLRRLVPKSILFVSESGISTHQDIQALQENNIAAALIGETFMRSKDKKEMLEKLLHGTKLKICGLRRAQDIAYVNQVKPDYIGYVFAPSKRQVTDAQAAELTGLLDPAIVPVGVFVNQEIDFISGLVKDGTIRMVQLHGEEDNEYIEELRQRLPSPEIKIIQAVKVKEAGDLQRADQSGADYILFDTYSGKARGGTGEVFDWDLVREYQGKPFFLAGGIDAANIAAADQQISPYCIDVSSGAESDGYKDEMKIKQIAEALRKGADK